MSLRRSLLAGAAVVASLTLAGCQVPVVTMIAPPGFGQAQASTEARTGPTLDQVRFAALPALCGLPAGQLVDGTLQVPESASQLGADPTTTPAESVAIAREAGTGRPFVALAQEADGIIGAAAVLQCSSPGSITRDRIVVWDGAMQPIGAITLSTLRGQGAVAATALQIDGASVRVSFTGADADGQVVAGGERLSVPLSVDQGHLVVGAIVQQR